MSEPIILAIESSCDDTSAAVIKGNTILSNIIASQKVHEQYGGVVPELASRAHQQNIVPVVATALNNAKVTQKDLTAIAYTRGPGLLGSLLVGSSFAKSMSIALNIPLIEVNHMQAHIFAHFISDANEQRPSFPFLCLTVSGGHTQIVKISSYTELEVLGETKDDAAGEAFDKIGKVLGLPYPAGPVMDRLAQTGNPEKFVFTKPKMPGYDFSFSGLKTGVMNFLNKEKQKNPNFVEENLNDLCASVQHTITEMCIEKLLQAAQDLNIKHIALAGGVSANSELRKKIKNLEKLGFTTYIPKFEYTTDNAAMIAMVGSIKYQAQSFSDVSAKTIARYKL
ncbi:tRNA (adenosine(37)-N6)-threonylcarbamoyltransferase complex transferase subunit TsaD [Ornithobacterium rhinotracheale]|uniref:tRNA N6-adenosine threonylcarbamoyltransferase n=2 Tax=Ornithobacterium rhinotracheale TaxID=28251 RepID=I3ZXL4_ORNRL|nr:tRNA (adenosine(37)-N6)-threonylcarbamoyltransferase complex transferase subunit TsaD [Ornithobacterium rhinotracheale]AFL96448.1 O-sialoglycoprotein endopeptidase [Ornithobacterium rhinotracheale DSM 15997]AIP98658.1 O-sialoglycoprotein endopeptidase [Ornithobacterium rhinotracheale ORT-UMN 88]KGB67651.1 O-sialoglycoprotein endopeptidase [Ornithobacterium rhinotracheale H06-030791]MBN3662173.1 tRNA (adenosine(37)-N6)-threonylcarbamoyltransferase complex transferase subunit TsaD [Ornithobact